MFRLKDKEQLYQWDSNVFVEVEDSRINQVQFSTKFSSSAYCVEVIDGAAAIPNEMLQSYYDINAYACIVNEDGQSVEYSEMFTVYARPKPDNYIYTPTEVITITEVKDELLKQIDSKVGIEPQEFTEEEKRIARENIGAISSSDDSKMFYINVTDSSCDKTFSEVLKAYNAGSSIAAINSFGQIFPLTTVSKVGSIVRGFWFNKYSYPQLYEIYLSDTGSYSYRVVSYAIDWDKDETEPGYIANRTHYVHRVKTKMDKNKTLASQTSTKLTDAQEDALAELGANTKSSSSLSFYLAPTSTLPENPPTAENTIVRVYCKSSSSTFSDVEAEFDVVELKSNNELIGYAFNFNNDSASYKSYLRAAVIVMVPYKGIRVGVYLPEYEASIFTGRSYSLEYESVHKLDNKFIPNLYALKENPVFNGNFSLNPKDGSITGEYATVEGISNEALAKCSHVEGSENIANGRYSHIEGWGNKTGEKANNAHVEGVSSIANGANAHAEGNYTKANGENSHAEGSGTIAEGSKSHAEGNNSVAYGETTHVEGYSCEAYGTMSHAEGCGTIAYAEYQHAQGKFNISDSMKQHAHIIGNGTRERRSNIHTVDWDGSAWYLGDVYVGSEQGRDKDRGSKKLATEEFVKSNSVSNLVNGTKEASVRSIAAYPDEDTGDPDSDYKLDTGAYALGRRTKASMADTFAIGRDNEVSGDASYVGGVGSKCHANYSHAEGLYTEAKGYNQYVYGKYNISNPKDGMSFIMGNGTDKQRSNSYTLSQTGEGWFAGDVYTGSTSGTHKDSGAKKLATEDFVRGLIEELKTELTKTNSVESNPIAVQSAPTVSGTEYIPPMKLIKGRKYFQNGITYKCTTSTGIEVSNDLASLVGIYVEVINS